MNADVKILYSSDFYKILDFRCKCDIHSHSDIEFSENFSISFIRSGNFIFNVFRNKLDSFNGNFLIGKPGHEHSVSHFDNNPDRCTVFSFDNSFYELLKDNYSREMTCFFNNRDISSILVKASTETEYLHYAILKALKLDMYNSIFIDALVIEMVNIIAGNITTDIDFIFPPSMKKYHLKSMEQAKDYMHQNYNQDISVFEIAQNALISPFHFNRLFKTFTGLTPHNYLTDIRLANANILLRHSNMPVTQIGFASGFNNAEHFSYAYKKKFNMQPSAVKKQLK